MQIVLDYCDTEEPLLPKLTSLAEILSNSTKKSKFFAKTVKLGNLDMLDGQKDFNK